MHTISDAPTRTRTWDLLLKREQLYQLSYGRVKAKQAGLPAELTALILFAFV